MACPKIEVLKRDSRKEQFKLIPLAVLEKRRKLNFQGVKPSLSINRSRKPKTAESASLKDTWPKIYNQLSIGSCTANAFCACFKYLCPDKTFEPSRLYVYYKERLLENPNGPIYDSGAWVVDGYSWVSKNGLCAEGYWPYDVSKVNDAPPQSCDQAAKGHTVGGFFQIKIDLELHNTIAWCLLQDKPVMIAFGVYKSFSNIGTDGLCPVPNPQRYNDGNDPVDPFYGGHEVVILGYDDKKRLYTVANSWGSDWGDHGFFYMPYELVENPELVYDFSVILMHHCWWEENSLKK
jgi:Cysteine protease